MTEFKFDPDKKNFEFEPTSTTKEEYQRISKQAELARDDKMCKMSGLDFMDTMGFNAKPMSKLDAVMFALDFMPDNKAKEVVQTIDTVAKTGIRTFTNTDYSTLSKEAMKSIGRQTTENTIGGLGFLVKSYGRLMHDDQMTEKDFGNDPASTILKSYWKGNQAVSDTIIKFGQSIENVSENIQTSDFLKADEKMFSGTFKENPNLAKVVDGAMSAATSLVGAYGVSKFTSPRFGLFVMSGIDAKELMEEPLERGEKLKAVALWGLGTAGTAAMEKLPFEKAFGKLTPKAGKKMMDAVRETSVRITDTMIAEGLTEGGQTVYQNILAKVGYDGARDIFNGAVEAVIFGALGGGMVAGVNYGIQNFTRKAEELGLSKEEQNAILQTVAQEAKNNPDAFNKALQKNMENTYNSFEKTIEEMKGTPEEQQLRQTKKELDEGYNRYFEELKQYMPEKQAKANAQLIRSSALFFSKLDGMSVKEWFDAKAPQIQRMIETQTPKTEVEEKVENLVEEKGSSENASLSDLVSEAVEETKAESIPTEGAIEDYGEKLEGAKKDLEYNVSKQKAGKNHIERVMNKVDNLPEERIYIANWLKDQSPEFVENLAKYNHKLRAIKTQDYKNQLKNLFVEHGNELGISGIERLDILYGDANPSAEIMKKYNIKPEREVYIEEGKHHIVKATPEYVERKLGERGKVSFMYARSTRGGHYLWVKKGSGGWHILESFSSQEEMEAHKASHTEEQLNEILKERTDVSVKEKPIRKRQGEDYRKGKNVTAQDFTETFGFRGVQFGNYESNEKRQRELNNAYDSLMDLANILNIPPKAISLEGKLGIAFGARGSGTAAAHYEPKGKIINITRDSGAGAIGHEWFHALDNYLAGGEKMATGGHRDTMRMELRQKLVRFLTAVEQEESYQSRLKLLGDYWKRKWEIGARAFEQYLVNKMEEKGIVNDYLAQEKDGSAPYMTKQEQSNVLPRLDDFINTIQTKETENGLYKLYQESMNIAEENARLDEQYPAYEGETITINGQEKTVYNSNGDRIAKSKEALENFYKWFGDSKVVDEQGRPLVVYHGTNEIFDTFDVNKIGYNGTADGAGFNFTTDKDFAERFTFLQNGVMPVYLKIENPVKANEKVSITEEQLNRIANRISDEFLQEEESKKSWQNTVKLLQNSLKSVKNANFFDMFLSDIQAYGNEKNETANVYSDFRRIVKEETGIDGYENEYRGSKVYIAFTPNQIKSTSNRGTYSESENIYLQSAFAGSRVDYDRPSLEAIGSGEGAQVHGWGLYYALDRDVAEGYRERFTTRGFGKRVKSVKYNGKEIDDDATKTSLLGLRNTNKENAIDLIKRRIKYADDETRGKWEELKDFIENVDESKIEVIYEKGQVHEVDIPENPYLLEEHTLFDNHSDIVKKGIINALHELKEKIDSGKYPDYQSTLKEMDYDYAGIEEKLDKEGFVKYKSGKTIYNIISEIMGSDKDASLLLNKHGIKGITYIGQQDGRCFVIFNPDDVKVIQKFYQENNSQGNANSYLGAYTNRIIYLNQNANESTLPHELAHFWSDMLRQSKSLKAKEILKQVDKWAEKEFERKYSIAKQGDVYVVTDKSGKTVYDLMGEGFKNEENAKAYAKEELFARGFEKYLKEGKAPSKTLKEAFENFFEWLKKIYVDLANLDIKLSPTMRKVYGEILGGTDIDTFLSEDLDSFVEKRAEQTEESKEQETAPEEENKEQEATKKEEPKETKETRERGLAKTTSEKAKAKGIEDVEVPTYEKRSSIEMAKKADEFVKNNKQLAIDIVKGLKPEQDGIFRQDLYKALEETAINEGDSDLLNELSRSMTVEEATELGQRIQALARGEIDPVKEMTELRDERIKKNKVTKKKIKEETDKATKQIKKEVEAAATPKEWEEFIKSLEC